MERSKAPHPLVSFSRLPSRNAAVAWETTTTVNALHCCRTKGGRGGTEEKRRESARFSQSFCRLSLSLVYVCSTLWQTRDRCSCATAAHWTHRRLWRETESVWRERVRSGKLRYGIALFSFVALHSFSRHASDERKRSLSWRCYIGCAVAVCVLLCLYSFCGLFACVFDVALLRAHLKNVRSDCSPLPPSPSLSTGGRKRLSSRLRLVLPFCAGGGWERGDSFLLLLDSPRVAWRPQA